MHWEAAVMLGILVLMLYSLAKNVASTDVLIMGAATVVMTLGVLRPTAFRRPPRSRRGSATKGCSPSRSCSWSPPGSPRPARWRW